MTDQKKDTLPPGSDNGEIEKLNEQMIPGWTADKIVINGQLLTIVYPEDNRPLQT